MSTIWTAAAAGTLTKGSLLDFLDKDPGLLDREDGSGLTPLGNALSNGKAKVVKLLLDNQANPDKMMGETMPFPDGRTPVYLAARAKKSSPRMMQLLLEKNPKSFDKPITSRRDETPLMAAIRGGDPKVIKMLIKQGASLDKLRRDGKSAQDLASALPDGPEKTEIQAAIQAAINPSPKKGGGGRGFRSYIKGWAVGVLGRFKIFKPLGSIVKAASRYFYGLGKPSEPDDDYGVKEPETVADFKENLNEAVKSGGLERFFPPGDQYLEDVAKRAAELKKDPTNLLNDPSQIQGLADLALYQTVLYCDDSNSMKEEGRWPKQTELAKRIADIAIQSVPNTLVKGVHLRFINKDTPDANNLNGDGVASRIGANGPHGSTPIGTELKNKILNPLVYSVLDAGKSLKSAYLIMIITDGCPWDENTDELRNSILECGRRLKAAGYRRDAVRFCLSQIGTDDDARAFLDSLDMDDDLEDVLYRTAELVDAKYEELRENEKDLQSWVPT
ncbi:ankyrin repeat protein [Chaetomium sp. MPI-CAGE-AT-0009]|nr:ankyrin repeat protein [Chaetomium sp. MPI-CAGE-AT-0009]